MSLWGRSPVLQFAASGLAATILIGLVTSVVGVAWTHQGAPLVTFGALILCLLFRPNGLFGRLGSS